MHRDAHAMDLVVWGTRCGCGALDGRMKSQLSVVKRKRGAVSMSEENVVWRYVRSTEDARQGLGGEEGATMEELVLESV